MPTTYPIITFIADPSEPDLYNDVNSLPNPFTMNVPIGISNTHPASTLYFKASLITPPSGYSNYVQQLGSVANGASAIFIFSFQRASPSLTTGELDETLTFRIDAYTDSGYSVAYANQSLSIGVHHFDHTDASWTVIAHDSFDDGTFDGYSNDYGIIESQAGGYALSGLSSTNFLSSPYSMNCPGGAPGRSYKSYNTNGYTKARFVVHMFEPHSSVNPSVKAQINLRIDNVLKKSGVLYLPQNQWCRLAFNMPIGTAKVVGFSAMPNDNSPNTPCIDDIWVIAK